jgi:hypothetical protein
MDLENELNFLLKELKKSKIQKVRLLDQARALEEE